MVLTLPGGNLEFNTAFEKLGTRYRKARLERKMIQEDVISHGFSVRHYQQLESGRPLSLTTFFRVAKMFNIEPEVLIKGVFNARRTK